MIFRKRANSVRRQEFVFVEHVAVNPLELRAIRNRKQQPRAMLGLLAHVHVVSHVRMVIEKPLHPPSESFHALQVLRLVGFDREQRDQAHDRTHLHRHHFLFTEMQHVVVKPVLLVPQSDTGAAHIVHRRRDVDEVLEEFAGHVFVSGILRASSIAIESMSRQNIAIQLVPSD